MKYVVALLTGLVAGMLLLAAAIYYNPFKGKISVSPLAVGSKQLLSLSYTAVPAESILFTNDGESISAPYPVKAAELWEPTLRNSRILVVELANSRGEPAGIGIKFSSDSEDTRLLDAQALVDSAWHIFMPGRGTLFVDQRENYWAYLRDIVVEARWNSADSWRGVWNRVMTTGPNALGTARVVGGNGAFAGIETEAVESLNATAYSARSGPVAMDGNLTISLPSQPSRQASTRN
jgi:hypothetical protein